MVRIPYYGEQYQMVLVMTVMVDGIVHIIV